VPKNINIKLRIDRDTLTALQTRATVNERSVAAEIRLAIRKHLENAALLERVLAEDGKVEA